MANQSRQNKTAPFRGRFVYKLDCRFIFAYQFINLQTIFYGTCYQHPGA